MHVLFVLDTWGMVGGTERHALGVAPALVERGHRVSVLARAREADQGDEGDASGPQVTLFPHLEHRGLWREARRELEAHLARLAPDVVLHCACSNLDAVEVLLERAPVVRFVHDHVLFCPGLNKLHADGSVCRDPMGAACFQRYYTGGGCAFFRREFHRNSLVDPLKAVHAKWRELALARRAREVLTNSSHMRAELLRLGFDPGTTRALPLFTLSGTPAQPVGELAPETRAFLARGDEPRILCPARLVPEKGASALVEALARVRAPFRAVLAGAGPEAEPIAAALRAHGLEERVRLAGWVSSAELEALYACTNLVAFPSLWSEPFGLVGLEAMAHGKPVVAFETGGVPDWLTDGENGRMVPLGDRAALAAAIEELLLDPERRAALGAAGRERLGREFGREAHVNELERTLLRCAAG